jgi:exodeoxyribonuclease VII small subunit
MVSSFSLSNSKRFNAATHGSPSVPKNPPPLPDFECALAEIENIVNSMEGGQLPLAGALDAYQRGVVLLRHCQSTLEAAGSRLQALDSQCDTANSTNGSFKESSVGP